MLPSTYSSVEQNYTRNARAIHGFMMLAALAASALFGYLAYTNSLSSLYVPSAVLFATFFFGLYTLRLIRRDKRDLAVALLLAALLVNVFVIAFTVSGIGAFAVIALILFSLIVVGLAMSSRYSVSILVVVTVISILLLVTDNSLGADRVPLSVVAPYAPYIIGFIALPLIYSFFRSFSIFRLQTKVTLGIILTGGFAVISLFIFNVNRLSFVSDFLINRYEENAFEKVEADLRNTTQVEANKIDSFFSEMETDLGVIADYQSTLLEQEEILKQGDYWNAAEKLTRLSGGQYGNSTSDIASVLLPNKFTLSDEMISAINASIHLDWIAPSFLEAHPEAVSIYYISSSGYSIYYPNIGLAYNVPPDYDSTQQRFFTIADSKNNPGKFPRITRPYEDPAGKGLMVTISIPVYRGADFQGVVGTDIQLSKVTEATSKIRISETGIAFLTDRNGLIIAMDSNGYQYFELTPEIVPIDESPKQTIFDSPLRRMKDLAQQILTTQSKVSKVMVGDVDTYVSVHDLKITGYKLVILAPNDELSGDIVAVRENASQQIAQTIRNSLFLLIALFLAALIISVLIGRIIAHPLKRLTETVGQIATGNLFSRAVVETDDESGFLAQAFNQMADNLVDTLQGLEDRISERTSELEALNQLNLHRAARLEAITRISHAINAAHSLDRLLPQTVATISEQLSYYHVGIFLTDIHKEVALLAAANSEGGKAMLKRGHQLQVSDSSIVGYVTKSGMPRIAEEVGQDAVYFNNPDLPETRSEIALPLRSGSDIIGVLDVQSKAPNAFTAEDVNTLLVLADQVSVAIQNAKLFQQNREALESAERAAAQLSAQQWQKVRAGQKALGFHFDGAQIFELTEQPKTTAENHLSSPIILRGTQIGSIKLSSQDPERKWDENEIAMAQAIAERTALAIESARLLTDAQKHASKERAIGQISNKIGSMVNIDNIVRTVAQELGETMSGADVVIQFTTGESSERQ